MNKFAALLGALVCALLCAAPEAAAQDVNGRVNDVTYEIDAPWPERLGKGYFPVFVRLENESGETRRLRFQTNRGGGWTPRQEFNRTVDIGAGKRLQLELLLPIFHAQGWENSETTYVSLSSGDEARGGNLTPGEDSWYAGTFSAMVFQHASVKGAADGDDFQQALQAAAKGRPPVYVPHGTNHQFSVRTATFAFLPQQWQGYSSLDAVVLDLDGGLPSEVSLAPLRAWVRLGGRVLVTGANAQAKLASFDSLAELFEERFAIDVGSAAVYDVGLGRIVFTNSALSLRPDSDSITRLLDEMQRATANGRRDSWVPMPETWRLIGGRIAIPGVDQLPLRAFMFLLFLFAVVIGPVNLIMIKRLRKPAMLLFTIPGLSLVASLAILGYGIFHQGIDTKLTSHTLTVLDQRSDEAVTVDERSMFAGLSPGHGLLPAPGTAVYPRVLEANDNDRFIIDAGEGRRELRSSFLPVRSEVAQLVMSASASQGRLELRAKGAAIEVTNQLIGADVEALMLRDTGGAWYRLTKLKEGQTATLEPLAWNAERGLPSEITTSSTMYTGLELVPGTYVARISANPFADQLGLETTDKESWHVVYGIFEEDWR